MNTNPSQNTSTAQGETCAAGTPTTTSASPRHIGSQIKGAMHVVHGVGDNIRGTVLGAIDTFAKNGDIRNEEIARHGRWETEQGLAALRGQPGATQQYTSYPHQSAGAAVGSPTQHSSGLGAENELGVSQEQHGSAQGPGAGGLGDKGDYHHRDEAKTDLNAQPGQHHSAGQLSSPDQKRMPSYDRDDKFDASQGGGRV